MEFILDVDIGIIRLISELALIHDFCEIGRWEMNSTKTIFNEIA